MSQVDTTASSESPGASPSVASKDLRDVEKQELKPPSVSLTAFAPGDPDDPHAWPSWRRYTYSIILGYATFALTYCSSAISASIPDIEIAYGISYEIAVLTVSLFVLAFAAGPLLWGPASEVVGRRPIYLVSYGMFTAFSIGVAFAPNTGGLLVMRFLAAFGGASGLSNAPASGGDFCDLHERAKFAAVYGGTLFLGPAMGPLLSGFINNYAGYKWNLRVEAIVAGTSWILVMLIPETYNPILLKKRAERQRDRSAPVPPTPSLLGRLKTSSILPFKLLFTEPIVIFVSMYMALLYGLLYSFFDAIPYAFVEVRGWSRDALALAYTPIALGAITGGCILYGPGVQSGIRLAKKRAAEGKKLEPEDRLLSARFIAPFAPIGLFIFAFTSYANVHWFGQMVGLYLFSSALVVIFVSLVPYIIDCYQLYAASALAATAFARATYASACPLFVRQQLEAMSVTGGIALYAGVSLLMTPIPFVFVTHGYKLRKGSRYAFA